MTIKNPPAPGADTHWPGYLPDKPMDGELFDPERQPIPLINGRCCPTCGIDSLIKGGTRKRRDGTRCPEYVCLICYRRTIIPLLRYMRRTEHLYLNYVWSSKHNSYVYDLVPNPKEVTND